MKKIDWDECTLSRKDFECLLVHIEGYVKQHCNDLMIGLLDAIQIVSVLLSLKY